MAKQRVAARDHNHHNPPSQSDSRIAIGETVVRNVAQAGAKKDVQFGCYLVVDEAGRLASYAEELQINRPNLGILLIVRELKCRRLQNLVRWNGPPVTKKNGVRVTARGNFPRTKELFQQRAAQLGLGMDEAVAMLFRAELKECWLEKSLSSSGNRA